MTQHTGLPPHAEGPRVTLRSPGELAEALPYLMGFHPDDSIVLVALHGDRSRFGGRLRLAIPEDAGEWPEAARQLTACFVEGARARGRQPDGILVFLCQDPPPGTPPARTAERLRPLAQALRTACGALDVPVPEALCVSGGRWWSYVCPDTGCCPAEGTELGSGGTSVMAAAAAFAGIRVRGSLKQMAARFEPLPPPHDRIQETALDRACAVLLPRLLSGDGDGEGEGNGGGDGGPGGLVEETVAALAAVLDRFRAGPPPPSCTDDEADRHDDALLTPAQAARLVLGLQDRVARDRAAEWVEQPDAGAALRLWRALARRCTGAYSGHAAAPLTLAGWVCWACGDEPAARVAFVRALEADPEYTFARLLHQACNSGLDPEPLRRCLREERQRRETRERG
ncbi:DUF4192 domain-containing protein [Streptomyces sp. HB2AG]|uniref:DUF4192 domain-containing protein n=1 Tax=Streptomyces sp. HB2AG TaxID=2983400 RepID=UPI0022AA553E|nr:DUF4192 domain-containing protein [Streptomyces sp. HB2AG]MCZ2527265.1 DUF4192 domain-containing protein [Streptomyces sp. HB2AG]